MATTQEEQQNEAGRHQEVGHKSLLQSDALYQVHKHNPNSTLLFYSIIKLYLFKKKKKFIVHCSISLKPVYIQKSQSLWRSSGNWQQDIHGKCISKIFFWSITFKCIYVYVVLHWCA